MTSGITTATTCSISNENDSEYKGAMKQFLAVAGESPYNRTAETGD
jgi:hypothetical protein